jgi:anaerobic selenocysteine-containing dehydrogenase
MPDCVARGSSCSGCESRGVGIHLVPYVREARKLGAKLVVIDPRTTSLARQADLHLAPRPGTDLPIALSVHRYLFERGAVNERFLAEHTRC